jgi:hypothetical protein
LFPCNTIDPIDGTIVARISMSVKGGLMRVSSGESKTDGLPIREARRLYGELREVEAKERAFRSDGRISGREEAELNRDLDRLAANVRDQMRDDQRRY